MLNFYNDKPLLIHDDVINDTLYWHSTDSKNNFKKQSEEFKDRFNYEIAYKFNNLGYRTKNLNELNDKFILTFGCSYTEGIGLTIEQIWNYAVAKNINLDLYNCAKEATGMDVQYYNSTLWKNSNLPLPKLVIIQWPHKSRKQFSYQKRNRIAMYDSCFTDSVDKSWWSRRYITNPGEMHLNNFMWFENFNNIWESLNVPVLNFSWNDDIEIALIRSKFKLWHIIPTEFDLARDNQHSGPNYHKNTAEQLLEILKLSNFTHKI